MSQQGRDGFFKPQNNQNQDARLRQSRPNRNNRFFPHAAQINQRTGHWTERENAKYYAFLKKFADKFSEKESRRQWKVFKTLARFVKTRNANQCRSHHHKMHKDSETIFDTIRSLQEKWTNLESRSQKYSQQLSNLQSSYFSQENDKKNDESVNENEKKELNYRQFKTNNREQEDQQEMRKKNQITLMRTGAGYEQQQVPVQYKQEEMRYYAPIIDQRSSGTYQTMVNPYEKINSPSFQAYNGYNVDISNSYGLDQRTQLTLKQNKVLEVHECFVRWITKLSNLIKITGPEIMSGSSMNINSFGYLPY